MVGAECAQCRELLDRASAAAVNHVRAKSRLDIARSRHETEKLPTLESAVQQALDERAAALEAYKAHRAQHGSS